MACYANPGRFTIFAGLPGLPCLPRLPRELVSPLGANSGTVRRRSLDRFRVGSLNWGIREITACRLVLSFSNVRPSSNGLVS